MAAGYLQTPIGILRIHGNQRLVDRVERVEEMGEEQLNPVIAEAKRQLAEYFAGERQDFSVFAKYPPSTPFQIAVWDALQSIPYGQTRTYGDIAAAIGNPRAVRAVGTAIGSNPLLILVPCHRVVAANGIGGFREGVDVKKWLLELEQTNRP